MDTGTQKSSYKLVWIAGVSVAVLAIVIGIVIAVMPRTEKKAADTSSAATTTTVVSKSEMENRMNKLDAGLKQAATDQASAATAIADSKKQVKVGN